MDSHNAAFSSSSISPSADNVTNMSKPSPPPYSSTWHSFSAPSNASYPHRSSPKDMNDRSQLVTSSPVSTLSINTPSSIANELNNQFSSPNCIHSPKDEMQFVPVNFSESMGGVIGPNNQRRRRLTEAETQLLLQEYARNAKPNSDTRKRLAAQIPGMSSRAVQIWFQNRRAKARRHKSGEEITSDSASVSASSSCNLLDIEEAMTPFASLELSSGATNVEPLAEPSQDNSFNVDSCPNQN